MTTGGRCLCGSIAFRVTGDIAPVLHCHCDNCRRVSGNFVAASRVADVDLEIDDALDLLRWHELDHARYAFCASCGSTLFFKAADTEQLTSVMVGAVDDVSSLSLAGIWFAGDAQPHHVLSPDVPHFAGNAED